MNSISVLTFKHHFTINIRRDTYQCTNRSWYSNGLCHGNTLNNKRESNNKASIPIGTWRNREARTLRNWRIAFGLDMCLRIRFSGRCRTLIWPTLASHTPHKLRNLNVETLSILIGRLNDVDMVRCRRLCHCGRRIKGWVGEAGLGQGSRILCETEDRSNYKKSTEGGRLFGVAHFRAPFYPMRIFERF